MTERGVKKEEHTLVLVLSACLRAKDPIDKRERSEFPQQQTYQCFMCGLWWWAS